MGCLKVSLIITQLIATVLLIMGIGGVVFSIMTPSWQTVYIAEHKELHLHGLWRDCQIKEDAGEGKDTKCTYKFNENLEHAGSSHSDHGHRSQHLSLPWHTTVLGLLGTGGFLALVALFFSFCAPWVSACALIWSTLCIISTICVGAGVAVYFFNSHDVDYLYIYASTQSYEQECGYSFWCAVASAVALLLSTVFSVFTTVLLCVEKRKPPQRDFRSRSKKPKHIQRDIVHTHWNTKV